MPSRTPSGESDPTAVAEAIERLERRVAALERMLAVSAVSGPFGTAPPFEAMPDAPAEPISPSPVRDAGPDRMADWTPLTIVTLAGRTLMALGGAYLLRALTEEGAIPPVAGVIAGFVYAQVWLALCARAATRGSRPGAVFHGLTAAIVAYPLVWETTARFALVRPATGAMLLGAFTALMFAAARLGRLQSVAWFGAIGATITALVLAVATTDFMPYTIVVSLVGIAALWTGYVDDWVGIRWPVAAAADLLLLAVTLRAVDPDVAHAVGPTIALQMFVLAVYLGSFVARTLVLGREVVPFEVVQSAAVMAVGFGGALLVLATANVSALPLGIAAVAFGAGAYAFSFLYVERRRQWRNLAFFTSLAVAFSMAGVVLVAPPALAVVVMGVLALLCAEWARRSSRLTLAVHAAIFAAAMAWLSALTGAAGFALGAPASLAWPGLDGLMLLALATVVAIVVWPAPASLARLDTGGARALRFARLALLVWTGAGVAVAVAVPLITGAAGSGADAGVVATIRTVVLVAFAVGLLALPRHPAHVERIWLAAGLLGALALKLLAEDLPKGRPATLFVALALYGAALVLAPRLARASRSA